VPYSERANSDRFGGGLVGDGLGGRGVWVEVECILLLLSASIPWIDVVSLFDPFLVALGCCYVMNTSIYFMTFLLCCPQVMCIGVAAVRPARQFIVNRLLTMKTQACIHGAASTGY
jgi:hypothetical protein